MLIDIFWSNVTKTETCWLWSGKKTTASIEELKIQHHRVHKIAYIISCGDVPKGFLVRHTCKNNLCCNPQHLVLIPKYMKKSVEELKQYKTKWAKDNQLLTNERRRILLSCDDSIRIKRNLRSVELRSMKKNNIEEYKKYLALRNVKYALKMSNPTIKKIEAEKASTRGKIYRKKNYTKVKNSVNKWRKENPDKVHLQHVRWLTENYPETLRYKDFRRGLGSEVINEWFINCHRHHINKQQIICIPKDIHKKYQGHMLKKPETMILINREAFKYLTETIKVLL